MLEFYFPQTLKTIKRATRKGLGAQLCHCHAFDFVAQFDDFKVFDFGAVDGEADEGADLVKAGLPGGTGVDVQAADGFVVHDLEKMGVAGNEKPWGMGVHGATDGGVVFAGVAANVLDEDIDALTGEAVFLGETVAQVAAVDVAIDGTEGRNGGEFVGDFHGADVASVPDFIALGKILLKFCIPMAVGVG